MEPSQAMTKTKLPKGFTSNSVNCGVRKYRPDIGLVSSETDMVVAGVFTKNECKAAPVLYCQDLLPSDKIRHIITNSGQANSATGAKGIEDNLNLIKHAATTFNCGPDQVVISSTGVIGVPLAMKKLKRGITELLDLKSRSANPFALAIMTTDLIPKSVYKDIELSSGTVRLTGVCKGSGMIHPNMATMLGYVFSDVVLTKEVAQKLVSEVADLSFNMISVDGETSTNDSFFLAANGASEVTLATEEDKEAFKAAFKEISVFLAKSIAADGEGATKLIEVHLKGHDDLEIVREAARGITSSPLIKTAIHGEDPNWGRIYSRLGQFGIRSDLMNQLDLSIQGVQIVKNGVMVPLDYYKMKTRFAEDNILIEVDFHGGEFEATAWGCDLSKKYIDINTEYN